MSSNTSNLYSTFGTTSSAQINGAIRATRPPTTTDYRGPNGNFSIGQLWVDTDSLTSFQLVDIETTTGSTVATWIALGGGSAALSQLSGDAGTAFPVGGNINIVGGAGITTSASGDDVTISLTGGAEAIDSVALDSGSAIVPDVDGQISILATTTAAAGIPIQTVNTGTSEATIEVQYASTAAATTTTAAGIASFNDSDFTVDASGFVSAKGGGFARSVEVDASTAPGTDPVVPDASGTIIVTAAQVTSGSAGTEGIRTFSGAANTWSVQIQQCAVSTEATISLNGVAHFNADQFSVTNGFVSLSGGGAAIDSVALDSGAAIVPDGTGQISIIGATVTASGAPIQTVNTGTSEATIEVQYASSTDSSSGGQAGLASFNDTDFTCDANGYVSLAGGAVNRSVQVMDGLSGTIVVPNSSGTINVTAAYVNSTSAGTTGIRTYATGANDWRVEVQQSAVTTAATSTLSGVAHFDSNNFTVTDGFVQLNPVATITTGTFTATIEFGGNATGVTYSSQQGSYMVIGTPGSGNALAVYSFALGLTDKGSSTGTVTLQGYPYDINPSSFAVESIIPVNSLTAITNQIAYASAGGNVIVIELQGVNGEDPTPLLDTNVTNTSQFAFTVVGRV